MLRLDMRPRQVLAMRQAAACAGDRYLLKLFRDFVFHQVGDDGAPLLNWGHIAEALAKLDAGLPEKARHLVRINPAGHGEGLSLL